MLSSHRHAGARKGPSTQRAHADAGYLRAVSSTCARAIITTTRAFEGAVMCIGSTTSSPEAGKRYYLETRLFSRCLADDVKYGDGSVLKAGTIIGEEEMNKLRDDPTVDRVRELSPITDDSPLGISAKAYGMSLATGGMVELGEAVGVIAAQSIGEPGTQLTMRTFPQRAVSRRSDIAGGLPAFVDCSRPVPRRTRPSPRPRTRVWFAWGRNEGKVAPSHRRRHGIRRRLCHSARCSQRVP